MTWPDEVAAIAAEAAGDMGLLAALVALRHVENGGPGREFGVLSVPAPTYAEQLHVAATSLRNQERRLPRVDPTITPRSPDGFFTPEFLRAFSARWCPVNAENDPTGLNANHADNLVRRAADARATLCAAIAELT